MAGLQLIIVLLLIVLNGLLAMSELAVVSARTSRLQQMAAESGLARIPFLERYSDPIGVAVVVAVITYLSLIIGELVPKRIALQQTERIACLVAPPMTLLSKAAAPLVAFLSVSGDTVLRLIGAKASDEPDISEEEIHLMIKQGAEAGIFHESERAMVSGVFGIGDRSAGELMTPRHRIAFLDVTQPPETNLAVMANTPHNFYPVCEGNTDHVIGIVATRELWRRHLNGEPTDVRLAMEPALFVPEIAPVITVIDQMRHQRSPMAIVVDEYGGVEGVLTLNDVLSDVVGEIDDPHATNIKGGVKRDDGSWLLDGVFPAHELRELLGIESLPGEDEGRFETVGGFVMDQLGHIPSPAESFEWDGVRYEVMDMDGFRVDKVLVSPTADSDDHDGIDAARSFPTVG